MSNTFVNGESQLSIRNKLNANTLIVEDKIVGKRYVSLQKNSDIADNTTISAGEATASTYKLLPMTFDNVILNGFTSITNGVKYTGSATKLFQFNGVSSLQSSAVNTIVDFRLTVNGVTVPATTSSVKLESTTAINTVVGCILLDLDQNDEVKVYVSADKACTISAFHTSLTLVEV